MRTLRSWTMLAAGPANSNVPRSLSADRPFSRLQTRMDKGKRGRTTDGEEAERPKVANDLSHPDCERPPALLWLQLLSSLRGGRLFVRRG